MIQSSWSLREKILGVALGIFVIAFGISLFWKSGAAQSSPTALPSYEVTEKGKEEEKKEEGGKEETTSLWVDVKGAVQHPGIYKMKTRSRFFQVIEQAGGLQPTADTNQLNLAQELTDGTVVYVPKKGETIPQMYAATSPATQEGSNQVNINTASEQELQSLNGIGPTKAKAIVQYRSEHGKFKSVEDITSVPGVGKSTFEKFKDQVMAR